MRRESEHSHIGSVWGIISVEGSVCCWIVEVKVVTTDR